jgi:hypothetical protein
MNFDIRAETRQFNQKLFIWRQPMDEKPKRVYLKEEEFLEEFSDVAMVAAAELNGEWCPDKNCGDATRKNQEHLRSTGELGHLVFNSAAIYYDRNVFASVEILLNSSTRVVKVRVKKVGGKLVAEKIVDRSA